MKIQYVVPFVPWQVRVRSYNLIPRLARNHEIHLVCVSGAAPTAEQTAWLDRYCDSATWIPHSRWRAAAQCALALPTRTPLRLAYCRSPQVRAMVKQVCGEVQPDLVYAERWRSLEFLPPDLDVPLVCDPTDSMTLYNQRLKVSGSPWEKLLAWEEHAKFSRCEGDLARRADMTVFCSRVDLDCVYAQAPDAHYEIVPNGVDCERFFFKEECETKPGTIVFTGSFKYRPNCHAVNYFLARIFPLILRAEPHATFAAVGNGATLALAHHRMSSGFSAVDFVPDLRSYLAEAAVAVAPITIGSGVSNKLAEGFAVGTPVVATPMACGDLPVKSGEHLLIADSDRDFADHVICLIRNEELRRKIALFARRFVEQNYDWGIVSKQMESLMCGVVGSRASGRMAQAYATA